VLELNEEAVQTRQWIPSAGCARIVIGITFDGVEEAISDWTMNDRVSLGDMLCISGEKRGPGFRLHKRRIA
jgi:hypothetical protein